MRQVRKTKKVRRTFEAINVSEFKMEYHISGLPKCPYCGGGMKLVTKPYFNNETRTYLECKNNDALHDVKCQVVVKTDKTHIRLISTPADRRLRNLRQQTHFYMTLLIKNHIFSELDDIYAYMNDRSLLGSGQRNIQDIRMRDNSSLATAGMSGMTHVGEMKEFGCQEMIKECVKLLYKNKDKLIERASYGNPPYETPELSMMLREIVGRKRHEKKIAC